MRTRFRRLGGTSFVHPSAIREPTVFSPVKTHGGKARLASRIIELIPPHIHYVEPYAGGLSVLLSKSSENVSEVVNDLDGRLTNFWQVLQDQTAYRQFMRRVSAIPFSAAEWHRAVAADDRFSGQFNAKPDVRAAAAFFVRCRQSLAGRQQQFAPLTRARLRRGMNEQAAAWLSAISRLPAVHARLQRVVVLCAPAVSVICQQDSQDTLFYCDPPYVHSTRSTTVEYGDREMTDADHDAMLVALSGIRGKFLLSGYANAKYDAQAAVCGWRRHDFQMANNAAGGKRKRLMTECVWTNY